MDARHSDDFPGMLMVELFAAVEFDAVFVS